MQFNTVDYIFFLPVVVVVYYLIPHRLKWFLLLFASYFFYGCWKVEYLAFIVSSTLIDFWTGIQMDKRLNQKKRRPFLFVSLVSNLGLLFFFKYYNFFASNVNYGTDVGLPIITDIVLPVGISFYTFQTISYSLDVYYNRLKAEKHLGYFALYVSFFPQLVAGPIERYSNLVPQFKQKLNLSYENFSNGFRQILFGLFTKMVIADNLSGIVDGVFEEPLKYSSFDLLLSTFFHSFQIYGDFFGYSIIAIGSARLLGIRLMENFKTPYLSKNMAEFWQRWHISLSTWLRDYVYFPMGGNRVSMFKWTLNIMVVFIVSGLWHGANWTFIFWGTLLGIVYLIEKQISKVITLGSNLLVNSFLIVKTFVIISIIRVFFRSTSIENAFVFLEHIFNFSRTSDLEIVIPNFLWVMLALFIGGEFFLYNTNFETFTGSKPFVVRWAIYSLLIFSIIVFAGVDDYQFIYFQF